MCIFIKKRKNQKPLLKTMFLVNFVLHYLLLAKEAPEFVNNLKHRGGRGFSK